jgi:hypothetical protein
LRFHERNSINISHRHVSRLTLDYIYYFSLYFRPKPI